MALVRAAWRVFVVTTRLRVVNPFTYLSWLVFPPLVAVVALYLLASSGASRVAYGVLGGGLIGFWSMTYIDGGQSIQDERWGGTLEQIFAVPTPLFVIVLGKVCASLVLGIFSFLPTFAMAYFGFHALLPKVDPMAFSISFVVMTFGFLAIATTLAPLFALSRWAFTMLNGVEFGVYALCGFVYPITELPSWVQPISYALAPTWAVKALYASATSAPRADYVAWLLISTALAVAYLAAGVALYRFVQVRARVSGELALA
jgi:ABC-2 type transport system permease protein